MACAWTGAWMCRKTCGLCAGKLEYPMCFSKNMHGRFVSLGADCVDKPDPEVPQNFCHFVTPYECNFKRVARMCPRTCGLCENNHNLGNGAYKFNLPYCKKE